MGDKDTNVSSKTEYISREAALDFLIPTSDLSISAQDQRAIGDRFVEFLESIPAADVRPVVRARWEWKNTDALASFAWTCSACGQRKAFKTNFCPNCGADMREG